MSQNKDFRSHSPGWALAVLAAISTCGFIDRIVMNVLVQPIKIEFGLSDTEIGLLNGLAFALLNVALGVWIARIGERRRRLTLVSIGTLLWSIATAACGLVSSFGSLALARVGVGVGEAVGLPASQSVVADYFPKRETHVCDGSMAVGAADRCLDRPRRRCHARPGLWVAKCLSRCRRARPAARPGLAHFTVAEPPRGQHDDLGEAGDAVPPLSAVLARMWQRLAFRHLLIGATVASLVGFGVNAFLAAFLSEGSVTTWAKPA